MRGLRWLPPMFGFAGVAMAGVAVVWYLVFQLVVLGITWSPSFDSVGWALDRCDITGSGEPLRSRQSDCFDFHVRNALAEAAEPYRQLSTRRNVPLRLSVALLAAAAGGPILNHRRQRTDRVQGLKVLVQASTVG